MARVDHQHRRSDAEVSTRRHARVIPYVDITFPVNAIREVIVGPGPHKELRKQAVEQLLAENKYTDTTVRTSAVPYRP
ncbi:hypothetical protein [Rhodococcus opacus]|uniref:hypothetical protein n=1 Tax=Rhodococcus opacus TaxID=37919 RepID=UPI000EA878A5|nr:hypothetical protein [Rhodococcus opacus]RKM76536.1 hypothetical protein COO55_34075 [Rhodococcus opacus]